jgi:hypothetical protein
MAKLLNVPLLQYQIPNYNTLMSKIKQSSGTNRNEQHWEDHVNRNSGDEIVHHTHIGNKCYVLL